MSSTLVIVESPTKVKTIQKYLPGDYKVLATFGHVRDLESKDGAVDPNNNFAMKYQIIEKNQKHVDAIRAAMKKADVLLLATDPDREGEAIAWSVRELLDEKKLLKGKQVHRIAFYEITKNAINDAIARPRDLSMDLVDAQQARRALDHLVGFKLSPLLWRKIRRGLSAGRVQSPALRMIVEREEEIEKFVSQEYWTIRADCQIKQDAFSAWLWEYQGEKVEQFSVTNEAQSQDVVAQLLKEAKGKLKVIKVESKQRKRNPVAPFTTSTLQQEASRKLGFTTLKTMRVAQQLYEGIDTGSGAVGLITYMRTDSVNLADDAVKELRDFIAKRYGKDNVPDSPRVYKTKSKNAQEAHEAIRPTSVWQTPDEIKSFLSDEQFKLYQLIWKRTVACQMIHATMDTVAVSLACGKAGIFRANGSVIVHPGFMAVYQEDVDDANAQGEDRRLPAMKEGDIIDLLAIEGEQHFTEPPPRYTEASLVKAMEEHGIGRPSTYVAIISTLQKREYVLLDKKRFFPTDVGRIVNKFLTQYFTQYVDYDFTAKLEDELDAISRGEKRWVPLLEEFWQPFHQRIEDIGESVQRKDVTHEMTEELCPECQKPLSIRLGKRGRFIGCTGYPECTYTRSLGTDAQEAEQEKQASIELVEGRECPKCQSALQIRQGRYGKFIGCTGYPKCNFIEPLEKPSDSGVQCPICHQANLVKRKSRYGKFFYSCERYPDCQYAVWDEPVAQPCAKCGWEVTTYKTTKRRGLERVCPQKECRHAESLGEAPDAASEA